MTRKGHDIAMILLVFNLFIPETGYCKSVLKTGSGLLSQAIKELAVISSGNTYNPLSTRRRLHLYSPSRLAFNRSRIVLSLRFSTRDNHKNKNCFLPKDWLKKRGTKVSATTTVTCFQENSHHRVNIMSKYYEHYSYFFPNCWREGEKGREGGLQR